MRGVADIGSKVRVLDNNSKEETVFHLVGSNEADVLSGKISDQSPVGQALIGHKKNDVVSGTVESSGYTFSYKILEVTRD